MMDHEGRRGGWSLRGSSPSTSVMGAVGAGAGAGPGGASSSEEALATEEAVAAFTRAYFGAVRATLWGEGRDGRVDPRANRAAFDARVAAALDALVARLAATVETTSMAPSLAAGLREALAHLATPSASDRASGVAFELESVLLIGDLQERLRSEVGTSPRAGGSSPRA